MQLPKQFRTVKQPHGSGACGACVAAMAVGRGLQYAKSRMQGVRHGRQIVYSTVEILKFLSAHGIFCGQFAQDTDGVAGSSMEDTMMLEVPIKGAPALVAIPGHWMFWDGEFIRDPDPNEPDTLELKDITFTEWVPLVYSIEA